MADDLMEDLRTIGDLLDRRGTEAMGEAPSADDTDLAPLFPLDPARPSSDRRPIWFGAAAAALLLAGGIAAIVWNRDPGTIGVASPPAIVALVPADVDTWGFVQALDMSSTPDSELVDDIDQMVLTPEDSGGDRSRTVVVTRIPWKFDEPPAGEPVHGSGLDGSLLSPPQGSRRHLAVHDEQREGVPSGLTLTAGPTVSVDELFEIAAAIDPEVRFIEQQIPGWDTRATYELLHGARSLLVSGYRSITPGHESTWISVATYTGVTDDIRWLLSTPDLAIEVEVRGGRTAWVVVDEMQASAVWTEAPGVVVAATLSGSNPDRESEREHLSDLLERLVPVDTAGWQAFDAEYGLDAEGAVGATTTTVAHGASVSGPDRGDAVAMTETELPDGRWLQLFERPDGQLCWAAEGLGEPHCDGGALARGADRELEARYGTAGEGLDFAYGFMPPGADRLEMQVRMSGAVTTGRATWGQSLWLVELPPGATGATLIFRAPDDDVIHEVLLDLE